MDLHRGPIVGHSGGNLFTIDLEKYVDTGDVVPVD
jgi:hypothetical protein